MTAQGWLLPIRSWRRMSAAPKDLKLNVPRYDCPLTGVEILRGRSLHREVIISTEDAIDRRQADVLEQYPGMSSPSTAAGGPTR